MPGDLTDGPYSATYGHDPHGNMTRMPHLPGMTWDELDHLRSTTTQVASQGIPGMTYYVHGADTSRRRKTTELQAAPGQTAARQKERVRVHGRRGGLPEFASDGTTITLERETLHIGAAQETVAMIETRTLGIDPGARSHAAVSVQESSRLGDTGA